eukprot:TRINITY_DN4775_c0_g1_i2.p1 TRINITY_DN4775_c0_g1~~TRINITY_DN4775_c0_g1_i2.p1  ORF type:complete len:444 (-),score=69.16 TRINITY_DN4775_c0_g1_i2:231-1562(-)
MMWVFSVLAPVAAVCHEKCGASTGNTLLQKSNHLGKSVPALDMLDTSHLDILEVGECSAPPGQYYSRCNSCRLQGSGSSYWYHDMWCSCGGTECQNESCARDASLYHMSKSGCGCGTVLCDCGTARTPSAPDNAHYTDGCKWRCDDGFQYNATSMGCTAVTTTTTSTLPWYYDMPTTSTTTTTTSTTTTSTTTTPSTTTAATTTTTTTTTTMSTTTTSTTASTTTPTTTTAATTTTSTSTSTTAPITTTQDTTSSWENHFATVTGPDQACRGATPSDNRLSYFLVSTANSLQSCQVQCVQLESHMCQGIEYNIGGRCELWIRPEGIGTTKPLAGYTCLRYLNPAEVTSTSSVSIRPGFELADGGFDRVCRGSSVSDNLASYFKVVQAASLDSCQQFCEQEPNQACQGIEHNLGGRCELWIRPGGIEVTKEMTGYTCLRYTPPQ